MADNDRVIRFAYNQTGIPGKHPACNFIALHMSATYAQCQLRRVPLHGTSWLRF
jgi:hypothetical protein